MLSSNFCCFGLCVFLLIFLFIKLCDLVVSTQPNTQAYSINTSFTDINIIYYVSALYVQLFGLRTALT